MNKAWKLKYFFTDWKTKKARENQTQNPTAAGAYSTGNWNHRHNQFTLFLMPLNLNYCNCIVVSVYYLEEINFTLNKPGFDMANFWMFLFIYIYAWH